MKRKRKNRGANHTRDPAVVVTLDSGSHINAAVHLRRTERPKGAGPGVRCNGLLGCVWFTRRWIVIIAVAIIVIVVIVSPNVA